MSSIKSAIKSLYEELQSAMEDISLDNFDLDKGFDIPDEIDLTNPQHLKMMETFVETVDSQWDNDDAAFTVSVDLDVENRQITITAQEIELPYFDTHFSDIWKIVKGHYKKEDKIRAEAKPGSAESLCCGEEEFKGQLAEDEETK